MLYFDLTINRPNHLTITDTELEDQVDLELTEDNVALLRNWATRFDCVVTKRAIPVLFGKKRYNLPLNYFAEIPKPFSLGWAILFVVLALGFVFTIDANRLLALAFGILSAFALQFAHIWD